jgi:aspartate/methionine/tyrosine aminotransferase
MHFSPFLLDDWLNSHQHSEPPVEFDLASSTGPYWTLRELLALGEKNALEDLLDTRLAYTRAAGSRDLCEAIAEMEGVAAEHVQVTTGAAEALLLLFTVAAEPGANVLVPSPSFPSFYEIPRALGLEFRLYSVRRENQFRVDPDEIRSLTDARTKLLLVNTPHNPTGATLTDDELTALHDFCFSRGIQFVSDQVYHPIYHGRPTVTAARLPHANVVSDFSKALCLSGLRLGWIVERDAARMEQYRTAHGYFTVSGTAIGERLGTLALRQREKILARARRVSSANLALLEKFMAEHTAAFGWIRPQGGLTAFPWLHSREDARSLCTEAARAGVLLAPGDCFGMPSYFRVGFGAAAEQFPKALARFSDVVRSRASLTAAASAISS